MKKNDILYGTVVDYTHLGEGVVKTNDFTFFVSGVLKDEEITFKILKLKKNYGYGLLIEVITPSKNRCAPFCEAFKKCGGCHLQHMSKQEQALFKTNLVKNNLKRIGGLDVKVNDCLTNDIVSYRNKAQFPIKMIDHQIRMGFYRIHSNDIVDINKCYIQSDLINEIFNYLKEELKHYSMTKCLRHLLIKHAFSTNEVMIGFISSKNEIDSKLIDQLVEKFSQIKSIILNLNDTNSNVVLGDKEYLLYGNDYIIESNHGLKFKIGLKSFFQVNSYQSEVLYQKAIDYANLSQDDIALDLYCGVGSITLCMAKHAKYVYGVEIVDEAIKNAKANAKLNNIENVSFKCNDAKNYALSIVESKMDIDVVMIDPPRKGIDLETINSIKIINPKRIVYVSCNPATLARDLNHFKEQGYECQEVSVVDMFMYTYHVESVALMIRKG